MANTILHKRSSTSGTIPSTGSLSQGELGINIADGRIYTKNNYNNIINLGVTSISGTSITPSSGNFSNYLAVNSVPVSLSGHSHTTVQQAESLVTTVFNETGSQLSKMTAVYINGGHGDLPTVQKAIATSDATSAGTYGLIYTAINNMESGQIIVFGSLSGVNTDPAHGGIAGATEGSVLYLSPTVSGELTTTKPYAPDHVVAIGTVVRVHQNEGVIEVRVQNGFELDELHNVAITGATNGQFLQYNSTNGLWVPSSSGNFTSLTINNNQIVTGTGVANHVAYWNSSSGIVADSGQLYWDSTNDRLGIGISSPSYKLDTVGDTRTSGNFYCYGAVSTTGYISFTSTYSTNNTVASIDCIRDANWGGTLLTHVKRLNGGYGGQYGTVMTLYDDPTGYPNQNTHFSLNTTSASANQNAILYIGSGNNTSNTRNSIYTETGGAFAVTRGNVGIGTNSPSLKLNVNPASDSNNGIQILNNSAGTSARSLLSISNGSYNAEISLGGTGFTNNGFYRQNRLLISGPFITDYVTGQHVFHIGGGGSYQAVSGSTQVGLWDATSLKVTNGIAGGNSAGSSLSLKSTDGVGTTDHIKLLVGNNGATEAMRIINNGNVGIGTTSPSYTLDVSGTIGVSGIARFNNDIYMLDTTKRISWDNGTEYIGRQGDGIIIGTQSTTKILVNSAGNVGIGTESPAESLTVYGDSKYLYLQAQNNTGAAGIKFGNTAARQQMYIEGTSSDLVIDSMNGGVTESIRIGYNTGAVTINESGSDLDFRVEGDTDANLVFVDASTDRVGIGTATPGYKLQVSGSFGATTKSFRIDHPSKKGYSLEYGSLESPYHGVRLTGRDKVVKGVGTVQLPDYLKDLIHDDESITIQLTNYKHGKTLYVSNIDLQNDQFIVKADRAKSLGELEFFWTLTGVRKDVEDLVVEKRN